MSSPDEMRSQLRDFVEGRIDVEALAATHPACECERASTARGSPGPVSDEEMLRFFLTSRSDVDAKQASKRESRPFLAKSLQKAYTKGLSVCRIDYAEGAEIEYTARKLYEIQEQQGGEFGGVLGVIDFPASAVRICPAGCAPMCVFDTPLEQTEEGHFLRPSHADAVNSRAGMSEIEKKASREVIYNQIKEHGSKKDAEQVPGVDLTPYLPRVMRPVHPDG